MVYCWLYRISHLLIMVNLLIRVLNVGPGHKPMGWGWLCPTSGRLIVIPVIGFFIYHPWKFIPYLLTPIGRSA
jgi:hypothetical protein